MRKEFEINGCIEVPSELSEGEFLDKFIDFIEDNNWSFGGGINEIIDGFYIDLDGKKGDHVLDKDLKELIYQGSNKRAVEIYMDLTGEDIEEAQSYVADLSKRLWAIALENLLDF